MKQLTCEMCGSTEMIKQDGVFVCQNCGCKYSVEEAKKLMIEGTVEVQGTVAVSSVATPVQTDSSHLTKNYLKMAQSALETGNYAEAEQYCNRILETDNENYEAWLTKGSAAGWQSTVANVRFDEATNCFLKAYTNAPDDKKADVISRAGNQLKSLSQSLVSAQCERFQKWPDGEEAVGFTGALTSVITALTNFSTKTNTSLFDVFEQLGERIVNAVSWTLNNKVLPEYKNDDDGHPSDYAFEKLITRCDSCVAVLALVFALPGLSNSLQIKLLELQNSIQKTVMNSCSWISRVEQTGTDIFDGHAFYGSVWKKNKELTNAAKAKRQAIIDKNLEILATLDDKYKRQKEQKDRAERAAEIQRVKNRIQEIDTKISTIPTEKGRQKGYGAFVGWGLFFIIVGPVEFVAGISDSGFFVFMGVVSFLLGLLLFSLRKTCEVSPEQVEKNLQEIESLKNERAGLVKTAEHLSNEK